MVEGILVVNLDPPYVGFEQIGKNSGGSKRARGAMKNCTISELRDTLIELGAICSSQQWPPRDCAVRVRGSFSDAQLIKAGLGNQRSAREMTASKAS